MTTNGNPTSPNRDRDAIIGIAFRRSLYVVGGIGFVAGGVLLARTLLRDAETRVADETTVEAPVIDTKPAAEVVDLAMPFTNVAGKWGIDFSRDNGARGGKLLPECLGGGVAIVDLDRDGRPDLLFVDGGDLLDAGPRPALVGYRNLPGDDGQPRFEPITGIPEFAGHGMGVAVGDVDADGDSDLYVSMMGRDRLLRNDSTPGEVRLADVSDEIGIPEDRTWSTGVGFADLDGDDDLDLIGLRYVDWSPELDAAVDFRIDGLGRAYGPPTGFAGTAPFLLINDRDDQGNPRLADESEARGLRQLNPETGQPEGKGLAIALVDLDGDGDLDIVGANDTTANAAWINDGGGRFQEKGRRLGVAFDRSGAATGAMGIDVATRPNRGGEETLVAIGNFANEPSSLFVRRAGEAGFFDDAASEGVSAATRRALTFGLLFTDLDLDGVEDLIQANGHLEEEISVVQSSQAYRQSAQVFRGLPTSRGGGFREVPVDALGDLGAPVVGRGLASGDLDLDGDLDLVLTQVAGPPLILRNDAAIGSGVQVRLEGSEGNPDGIGAVVVGTAGDRVMVRRIMPTRSYLSQVEPVAVFGLGEASALDRLEVRWPDGAITEIPGPIDAGRIRVSRDSAEAAG